MDLEALLDLRSVRSEKCPPENLELIHEGGLRASIVAVSENSYGILDTAPTLVSQIHVRPEFGFFACFEQLEGSFPLSTCAMFNGASVARAHTRVIVLTATLCGGL